MKTPYVRVRERNELRQKDQENEGFTVLERVAEVNYKLGHLGSRVRMRLGYVIDKKPEAPDWEHELVLVGWIYDTEEQDVPGSMFAVLPMKPYSETIKDWLQGALEIEAVVQGK